MRSSLRQTLVIGFGAALIVLAAVAVEAYRALNQAESSSGWVEHTHVAIESLSEIVLDLVDAESAERGYLLTHRDSFRLVLDTNAAEVQSHLAAFRRLVSDNPEQEARADSLERMLAARLGVLRQAVAESRAGNTAGALSLVGTGASAAEMDSVRVITDRMIGAERSLLDERSASNREHRRYSEGVMMAAFLIAVLIALGAAGAILRDVAERERVAAKLEAAMQREQEANRAKSDFLARMSHELRTPLNSVIGFAGILLKNKRGVLGDQEIGYAERIRANGTHLLGIINDILDLAKVESGRMDLVMEPVDVNALVRETVAQLGGQGKVPVRMALAPGALPLAADRAKLKQILINLVGNAAKFTERGLVLVRVVTDPVSGRVRRLDVSDTGPGIPADRIAAIFDAFEQVDSSTERRFGGTGLGLAIARSMAQRMGFHLEVASEIGVGSTFSLICADEEPPLQHVAPAAGETSVRELSAAPLPAPSADASQPTVLVVDDSADTRVLLGQFLEDDGKHVVTAVSGEQGIQMARELRPDLIILDLMMPGMDGRETLRRLKDDAATRPIPVMIVSIVAHEYGDIPGAIALVDKPIDRDELVRMVRKYVHPETHRVLMLGGRTP